MYLVDANIFLEVELGQERAEEAAGFLESVADGEVEAAVPSFHVDAVVVVMEAYDAASEDVVTFLSSLSGYDGLDIINAGITTKISACARMKEGLDFDDALAAAVGEEEGVDAIVSYDTDFDAVEEITRRPPSAV